MPCDVLLWRWACRMGYGGATDGMYGSGRGSVRRKGVAYLGDGADGLVGPGRVQCRPQQRG